SCCIFYLFIQKVVNASSGIQPQTSEHLLLCSIFCPNKVVIVLNKTDLVKKDEIPAITRKVRKALVALGILENSPIVPLSLVNHTDSTLTELLEVLQNAIFEPHREVSTR
ncbi:Tr-type G domain-containing protein, partial [Trichostrongylus colubriformis]